MYWTLFGFFNIEDWVPLIKFLTYCFILFYYDVYSIFQNVVMLRLVCSYMVEPLLYKQSTIFEWN